MTPWVLGRLGTSVCQVTRDQKELDLTASDGGCNWFLLSVGCNSGRYDRVAHGTGLIPNETQFPCRTLVACLVLGRQLPSPPLANPPPLQTPPPPPRETVTSMFF